MVSFIVYDLVFMILFGIVTFFILHRHKENLKRQGWMFLYHTKVGLKFIDWVAKKFERVLKPLSYVVITSGYILMASILWMISRTVWLYVTTPIPQELKNLPPIAPLIPYFPKLFGLESFFPPLYFTYFLVALAIVAVSHEFAHGIFARLWGIKVKTTGLAFFGPFFGAFVEPDEKKMAIAPKKHQLSILAAGTFANILMTIVFGLLLWGFFAVSFTPGGVVFNAYAQSVVNVTDINHVENYSVVSIDSIYDLTHEGLNKLQVGDMTYYAPREALTSEILNANEQIIVFDDAPAIRENLFGAITSIDGVPIKSTADLSNSLQSLTPGEEIIVTTVDKDGVHHTYNFAPDERNGKAYFGIGFYPQETEGFRGAIKSVFAKVKAPNTYYVPTWDGEFAQFIYDMLWWVVVINILVALMNMLPVSILDGGRFFYITIIGITGSEKAARKAYSWISWFILLLLVAMMGKWTINFIIN
ncbi:MAG: site-2 protease family protein [Candidatus Pacearchaeota archaeon]